jgi:hypothetical protein
MNTRAALILGIFLFFGLVGTAFILGDSAIKVRELERVVTAKGLAERDVPADIAIWPLRFSVADNDLAALYVTLEANTAEIVNFLQAAGFTMDEVTAAAPIVTDRLAERYGDQDVNLRYTALQIVTVYSTKIDLVRQTQGMLGELGKKGIALGGDEFTQRTQYLFSGLNDLKPAMVQEATQNARIIAEQFAADADSGLGKLKSANQGQFTIEDRDANTPYLKKVRVVSTVEYYLAD